MTLTRTIVLLAGGLLLMLAVIVLRAETRRLHFRTSEYDSQIEQIRQELRNQEIELQRLRNPEDIRNRALQLIVPVAPAAPGPKEIKLPPPARKKPR